MKNLFKKSLLAIGLLTIVGFGTTFARMEIGTVDLETNKIPEIKCTVDFTKGINTCDNVKEINLTPSKGNEMFFELDMTPTIQSLISKTTAISREQIQINSTTNKKAIFEVQYAGEPDTYYNTSINAWTINVGDSITNNGRAGDSATQSNDAELHITDRKLSIRASDYGSSEELFQKTSVFGQNNNTPGGYKVKFTVSDGQIERYNTYENGQRSDKEIIESPYLFALNGQSDNEGNTNYNIYAAFNRVIANNSRNGNGVVAVTISIIDDNLKPDLIVNNFDLAYGYGNVYGYGYTTDAYGYGVVELGESVLAFDTVIANQGLVESNSTFATCIYTGLGLNTFPMDYTPIIAAFDTAENRIRFTEPDALQITATPGYKTLSCEVDIDNDISETNENNNNYEFTFVVEGTVDICAEPITQLACSLELEECPAESMYTVFESDLMNEQYIAAGTNDVLLGEFSVTKFGASASLESISLKNIGNIDHNNLVNIKLYTQAGELIQIKDLNSLGEVTFMGINQSLNQDFYVEGDIISSANTGEHIKLQIIDAGSLKTSTNEEIENQGLPEMLNTITIGEIDYCETLDVQIECFLGNCPAECIFIDGDLNGPGGQDIPTQAIQVDFMNFEIEANSSPATITEFVFEKDGLNQETSVDNINLYRLDGTIWELVGSCITLDNDFCFITTSTTPGTFSLEADVNTVAGDTIKFEVSSITAVQTETLEQIPAENMTGFPIEGNTMTTVNYGLIKDIIKLEKSIDTKEVSVEINESQTIRK